MASTPSARELRKRGCRGCLKWLLIVTAVLAGIALIAAFFLYRVPHRIGLIPSPAKRQLEKQPDRAAAQDLLEQARAAGMNTNGASLYVLPYKDGDGSVAVLYLDARDGFAFSRSGTLGPVAGTFVQVGNNRAAEELGIAYVTMTYVSSAGRELMRFAASHDDIVRFANGQTTEEEFTAALAGDFDFPAMMQEQLDSVQEMLQ